MYKKLLIILLLLVIYLITKNKNNYEGFNLNDNLNDDFNGKTFLITGSSRGIGFALCKTLIKL